MAQVDSSSPVRSTVHADHDVKANIAPPVLVAPIEHAPVNGSEVTFRWREVPGAAGYGLQVAKDPEFAEVLYRTDEASGTLYRVSEGLTDEHGPLFWRMRSRKGLGFGPFSAPASFAFHAGAAVDEGPWERAQERGAPGEPLRPDHGVPVEGGSVTLLWTAVPNARAYDVQVGRDETFERPVFATSVEASNSLSLLELLPETGAVYYWRVRPVAEGAPGLWSRAASFRATTDRDVEAHANRKDVAAAEQRRKDAREDARRQREAGAAAQEEGVDYVAEVGGDNEMRIIFSVMLVAFAVTITLIAILAP